MDDKANFPWSQTKTQTLSLRYGSVGKSTERPLLYPLEEEMGRQYKNTSKNKKTYMAPAESRDSIQARSEHPNTDEAEENDLKSNFMKIMEDFKEDVRKSLKEMEEKTNQEMQEIEKSLKEIQKKKKKSNRRRKQFKPKN
ncbi:AC109844.1 [Phodopus roborovskii]|uniref:AC109844.1 protein n=1 Tax=Phodopus roborovskii TaxID=109678 RepID=A0AAV0A7P6_PHORO|nr:AC109844.1 [Phodopus roborovskii]